MIEDVLPPGAIGGFVVALARTGGMVATAPVIGDPTTPIRARLAAAVALALVIAPMHPDYLPGEVPGPALIALATGIIVGLTARLVLAQVAVAGQLVGLSLGLGFASQYDPLAAESASAIRSLLTTVAGLAFITAGGLEAIARGAAVGAADPPIPFLMIPALLDRGADAFAAGFTLAVPIVIAALVGNLGLALMNRAAPAINVFSISLPAILILGGVALWLSAPAMIGGVVAAARTAVDVLATPGGP